MFVLFISVVIATYPARSRSGGGGGVPSLSPHNYILTTYTKHKNRYFFYLFNITKIFKSIII